MDSSPGVFRHLRGLVSGKKRRYKDGEFDLDLAYVTPRLIGMGYPSSGFEVAYRNPAGEVSRFLESRHAGHFKVFNLCSERDEDLSSYFPLVEYFPFCDHNPCPLELLTPFCKSVDAYLSQDPLNVVAIHCKAGKGRTGLVISAYLLHAGICEVAEDALKLFALARTYNGKGVTIPSQIRYVHYYEQVLRGDVPKVAREFQLLRVRLLTIPSVNMTGGCEPYFKIRVWRGFGCDRRAETMYSWKKQSVSGLRTYKPGEQYADFPCEGHHVYVSGDVQIVICSEGIGGMKTELCSVWFHTDFCEADDALCFTKPALDRARKDKNHKRFSREFAVEVFLRGVRRCGGLPHKDSDDSAASTRADTPLWQDESTSEGSDREGDSRVPDNE